jgi:hypothetical protein
MIQKISLDHQNCHIIHQNIMFRFIYTTTKGKRAPKSRSLFFRSIIYRIISSLWIRLCPKRKRQHCWDLCEDLSLHQQWRRDRSTVCGPVIPVRKAAKREQQWQQSQWWCRRLQTRSLVPAAFSFSSFWQINSNEARGMKACY